MYMVFLFFLFKVLKPHIHCSYPNQTIVILVGVDSFTEGMRNGKG